MVRKSDLLITILAEDGYFTYVGQSMPGTATSAAEWKIFRINEANNGTEILRKTFANNTDFFDKVWNDFLTYNYDIA